MNGPRWIKQWIADLALLNEQFRNDDGSVDFEALGREEYMFRTALITQRLEKSERARDTYMKAKAAYDASSENGKKGGRPRKNPEENQPEARQNQRTGGGSARGTGCSMPPVRSSGPMPADVQKVYDFASSEGLDHDDAYECWYVTTVERNGNDADGNPVTNWKPFLKKWCNTRKTKRSA